MPKRLSDGREIERSRGPLTGDEITVIRDMGTPHARAVEEIAARREAPIREAQANAHDEAVAAFDRTYTDVISDPALSQRAIDGYEAIARQAAAQGRAVDWNSELSRMGEAIRQHAGLPTSEERLRAETLRALRQSRGQK